MKIGKRSKSPNEIKSVKNIDQNHQIFLEMSSMQKEVLS